MNTKYRTYHHLGNKERDFEGHEEEPTDLGEGKY